MYVLCFIRGKVHQGHKTKQISSGESSSVGSYGRDADMDGTHTHLTVTTFLSFLVLTLLQASVQAQEGESIVLSATFR